MGVQGNQVRRTSQALRGSIFDNRLNDEGAPERHRAQNWMALRASISHSFMALTRDHEITRTLRMVLVQPLTN